MEKRTVVKRTVVKKDDVIDRHGAGFQHMACGRPVTALNVNVSASPRAARRE